MYCTVLGRKPPVKADTVHVNMYCYSALLHLLYGNCGISLNQFTVIFRNFSVHRPSSIACFNQTDSETTIARAIYSL